MRHEHIVSEIIAAMLLVVGIYFILWGIDLLMPNKYSVVAGVASLGVGLLIIGGGISLLRTLLLSLTLEKKEKEPSPS